jgi:hypothetical protein
MLGKIPAEWKSAIVLEIYKKDIEKIRTTTEGKLIKFLLLNLPKTSE